MRGSSSATVVRQRANTNEEDAQVGKNKQSGVGIFSAGDNVNKFKNPKKSTTVPKPLNFWNRDMSALSVMAMALVAGTGAAPVQSPLDTVAENTHSDMRDGRIDQTELDELIQAAAHACWSLDSAASNFVVDKSDFNAIKSKYSVTVHLETAKGATTMNTGARVRVPYMNEIFDALVLEYSPNLAALGKLVETFKYKVRWEPGDISLRNPEGKEIPLFVKDNVPLIVDTHSAYAVFSGLTPNTRAHLTDEFFASLGQDEQMAITEEFCEETHNAFEDFTNTEEGRDYACALTGLTRKDFDAAWEASQPRLPISKGVIVDKDGAKAVDDEVLVMNPADENITGTLKKKARKRKRHAQKFLPLPTGITILDEKVVSDIQELKNLSSKQRPALSLQSAEELEREYTKLTGLVDEMVRTLSTDANKNTTAAEAAVPRDPQVSRLEEQAKDIQESLLNMQFKQILDGAYDRKVKLRMKIKKKQQRRMPNRTRYENIFGDVPPLEHYLTHFPADPRCQYCEQVQAKRTPAVSLSSEERAKTTAKKDLQKVFGDLIVPTTQELT